MTEKRTTYTEARKRANRKWDAANMKVVNFRLLREGDKDIIEHVEKQSRKADYFRKLIRDDIAKKNDNGNYLFYEIMYSNDDQEYGDGEENLKDAIERVKQLRAGEYPEAYIIVTENRNGNIVELAEIREIR